MGQIMIVANQTLGTEKLKATVEERIAGGDRDFYVVVPATLTKHEALGVLGGFEGMSSAALAQAVQEEERRVGEARERAERRLAQMLDQIRAAGGTAEGEVGNENPLTAVKEALRGRSFDEVILSTLPSGTSRWLKMDLPSRVARSTKAPVTTVKAEPL